ncbi:piggyBac transposable element-derived protein 2-like [Gordionus sp. m RMFG-2023]|uniref:piggyBac transposable element-derived protein 2-like n=1 Tax=Gordionus sp. m RMFG-2023 TaxID=3053472 RepID=UPI0031FCA20B
MALLDGICSKIMESKNIRTVLELFEELEDRDFTSASIYLVPPQDFIESEEDSWDEDKDDPIDNLTSRQLRSQAILTIKSRDDIMIYNENIPSSRKTNLKSSITWEKTDLNPDFPIFPTHADYNNDMKFQEPIDYFELFFDNDVCQALANYFISYARLKGDHLFQTDANEIKCYTAILLLSGYINVPRWRMLWETHSETYNWFVANSMSRNRFELLKRYTQLSDNNNPLTGDRFGAVTPILSLLNQRYLKYARISEFISIDESMVPNYGKHSAYQFLKGKHIHVGYKIWCMCNPSGYLIQFIPYHGKENQQNLDLGVGGSVVIKLVSYLPPGLPYKIYANHFFSSINLAYHLKNKGIGYTGTILANKIEKCPICPETLAKCARGSYDYRTDAAQGLAITGWNDNRLVMFISTADGILPIEKVSRWVKIHKTREMIEQPNVVAKYNIYMGGVGHLDQNIKEYRVGVRSNKWWWPLFGFALDACVNNSWHIYKESNPKKELDLLGFRRAIVTTYLMKYGKIPASAALKFPRTLNSRVPNSVRFDRDGHWLISSDKQNRCALCRKNSRLVCEKCRVNLHIACAKTYHSQCE